MTSIHRFGEPGRNKPDSNSSSAAETFVTALSNFPNISPGQPRSRTMSSAYGRQRTDTRATYINEYELEIACWQARIGHRRTICQLTCSVCLETMEPSVWIRPAASCAHEPRICEPCLVQLVVHAIQVGGLTEVLCPDVGCRREMDYEDVILCIQNDRPLLDRYNQLVTQRNMERHPNFVWCQNPMCSRGQIHDKGAASPLVICRYCDARTCFTHQVLWHKGLTCRQYSIRAKRRQEIHANEEYIGAHTKRCPNPTCRRPIEKAQGCDHMTCRKPGGCGHEFCWDCLADYGPIRLQGNHRHKPGCRHYTGGSSNEFAEVTALTVVEGLRARPIRQRPTLINRRVNLDNLTGPFTHARPVAAEHPHLTVRDAGRMVLQAEANGMHNQQPPGPVTSLVQVRDRSLDDSQGNGSRPGMSGRRRGLYII
ncbi:unnamed protein product [Rhizoctonia solani]|uniref:RBR-type E3 ubiquitin transferase n=1 Tax=Rhizoctonia solani TaxID=456999 RepID=A0A8H2WZV3_9AGAM|nr:unnamed protein product [Rhizoctonia solani]